jgi:hypothetical protein
MDGFKKCTSQPAPSACRFLQQNLPMSDIAVHSNISWPRRHSAQENRCAFDRRNVVAITLRGSRDHIFGGLQTCSA